MQSVPCSCLGVQTVRQMVPATEVGSVFYTCCDRLIKYPDRCWYSVVRSQREYIHAGNRSESLWSNFGEQRLMYDDGKTAGRCPAPALVGLSSRLGSGRMGSEDRAQGTRGGGWQAGRLQCAREQNVGEWSTGIRLPWPSLFRSLRLPFPVWCLVSAREDVVDLDNTATQRNQYSVEHVEQLEGEKNKMTSPT